MSGEPTLLSWLVTQLYSSRPAKLESHGSGRATTSTRRAAPECGSNSTRKVQNNSTSESSRPGRPLAPPFRFVDLPRELRDQIYDDYFEITPSDRYTSAPQDPDRRFSKQAVAIVWVNHQVREEALERMSRGAWLNVEVSYNVLDRKKSVPTTLTPWVRNLRATFSGQTPDWADGEDAVCDWAQLLGDAWDYLSGFRSLEHLVVRLKGEAYTWGKVQEEEFRRVWVGHELRNMEVLDEMVVDVEDLVSVSGGFHWTCTYRFEGPKGARELVEEKVERRDWDPFARETE